jgi:hypothetical protein
VENADRAWAADVVRHEHIDIDPHIIPRLDPALAGVLGNDLFGNRHPSHAFAPVFLGN